MLLLIDHLKANEISAKIEGGCSLINNLRECCANVSLLRGNHLLSEPFFSLPICTCAELKSEATSFGICNVFSHRQRGGMSMECKLISWRTRQLLNVLLDALHYHFFRYFRRQLFVLHFSPLLSIKSWASLATLIAAPKKFLCKFLFNDVGAHKYEDEETRAGKC